MKKNIVNLIKQKIHENMSILSTTIYKDIERNKIDYISRGLFSSGTYVGQLIALVNEKTTESLDESLLLLQSTQDELNRKLSNKEIEELSKSIISSYIKYTNTNYMSNIPNLIMHIPSYPIRSLELYHNTLLGNIKNKTNTTCEQLKTKNKLKKYSISDRMSIRQLWAGIIGVVIAVVSIIVMILLAS